MTFADFHFLRPDWLLVLIPAALLIVWAARRQTRGGGADWAGLVDAHLLRHLTVTGAQAGRSRWLPPAFGAGLIAAVLAMAGPTWQKQPTPAFRGNAPSVIVLSLAQSMNSTDLVPSRLTRAGHKLRDMLDQATGEDTALVIYADRPFVAAPLTSDADVIRQMLPELSTSLMPVLGDRLDLAIIEAQALLDRAGAAEGRIIVLADGLGLDPEASLDAARKADAAGYSVNVLGIGTTDGATLQTASGRAIRTRDGQNVTVRLDVDGLAALAAAGGGAFAPLSADDSDLARVFPDQSGDFQGIGDATDQVSDTWVDAGYFLLFIPVLLAPLAFRRGLILVAVLGLAGLGSYPRSAAAGMWDDLWRTPDQQAQAAFDAGNYAEAARLATRDAARGAAQYRNGDYAAAAAHFAADDYNRANALARSGAFEEALAAYDTHLATTPDDADARFNRDIVAKLLEQEQQQEEQQDQQQQDNTRPGDQPDQQGADPQNGQLQDQPGQQGTDPQDGQPQDQSDQQGTDPQNGQPQDQPGQQRADPQAGQPQDQPRGQTGAQTDPAAQPDADPAADDGNAFTRLMDQMLGLTPDQPQDPATTGRPAALPLNQAAEQQLRQVPDDPSGLLRARIRQHYDSLRAQQN